MLHCFICYDNQNHSPFSTFSILPRSKTYRSLTNLKFYRTKRAKCIFIQYNTNLFRHWNQLSVCSASSSMAKYQIIQQRTEKQHLTRFMFPPFSSFALSLSYVPSPMCLKGSLNHLLTNFYFHKSKSITLS